MDQHSTRPAAAQATAVIAGSAGMPRPTMEPPVPPSARSGARDAAFLVSSQLVAAVSTLGTGIVLARTLGPAGKGFVDVTLASAALLQMLLGLSLGSGIFYHAARGGIDHRRAVGATIGFSLISCALVAVVLPANATDPLVRWLLPSSTPVQAAWLVVALLGVLQLQQCLQGLAKGRGHFVAFGASEVTTRTGALLLVGALAVASTTSPAPYVLAFLIAAATATLFLAADGIRGPAPGKELPVRAIVGYSLPLYAGNLVQFLNYRLDVFFVKASLGLDGVGRYTVAVWLAQTIWLVPNALAALVLRSAAADPTSPDTRQLIALLTRGCLLLSATCAAGIALLAGPGVRAVFGADFDASVPALLLLLPGVVLFAPVVTLSAYLNGLGRQSLTTWVACGSLLITVAMNIILIPRLGIEGAALASTASYSASAAATVWLVLRVSPELTLAMILLPRWSDVQRLRSIIRLRLTRTPRGS